MSIAAPPEASRSIKHYRCKKDFYNKKTYKSKGLGQCRYFRDFCPKHPSYLIHQRLKITKCLRHSSPEGRDETAKFLPWEYRTARESSRKLTKITTGMYNSITVSRSCIATTR